MKGRSLIVENEDHGWDPALTMQNRKAPTFSASKTDLRAQTPEVLSAIDCGQIKILR